MSLTKIQQELHAPKGKRNDFAKFNYRNAEDILGAVKPLLKKYDSAITLSDEIVEVGGRIYVKATATLKSGKEEVQTTAYAREQLTRKGMDESQITGSASSYARKYALQGLLAIDDGKDADSMDNTNEGDLLSQVTALITETKTDIEAVENHYGKKVDDLTYKELQEVKAKLNSKL